MRNPIYVGRVESRDYGVSTKGDFEPLVEEATFYRVQSVLSGRVPITTPQQRVHPDFPLRAFVRCESCGQGLTGSWSKGRSALTVRSVASRRRGPSRTSGSARSGLLALHPATRRRREAATFGERRCVDSGQRCGPLVAL